MASGEARLHRRFPRQLSARAVQRKKSTIYLEYEYYFSFSVSLLTSCFFFRFHCTKKMLFVWNAAEWKEEKKNNKQQATQSVKSASTKYQQRALSLRINNKNSFLV